MGAAYGFVFLGEGQESIESMLSTTIIPLARREMKFQREFNISAIHGPENLQTEDPMLDIAREEAGYQGLDYVLVANLPQSDNRTAARKLGAITAILRRRYIDALGFIIYYRNGVYEQVVER